MGLSKLKMQELRNIIERGCNKKKKPVTLILVALVKHIEKGFKLSGPLQE